MNAREAADTINGDIEGVVGSFVSLTQKGTKLWASCPFHEEKTPSFYVTPGRNQYYCNGCHVGGDAIHFIQKYKGCDFLEACEAGAKELGFEFKREDAKLNPEKYQREESIRILNGKAADFYTSQLFESPEALKYLTDRGFEPNKEDLFRVGFAPNGNVLSKYWGKKNGYSHEQLKEAGLIKTNDANGDSYDTFRNRLMFPICAPSGKVIGFTGRTLDPDPKENKIAKYLNTAEIGVFKKGEALFGLNIARPAIRAKEYAYLVEGNTDVTRMHSVGANNTVAGCGTAFTVEHARLLKKSTDKVTLIYDGDPAGQKAMHKNAEILIREQFYVSVIILEDGVDPDDAFKTAEDLAAYTTTDYFMHRASEGVAKIKGSPALKSEFIKETVGMICCYTDTSKQEVYIDTMGDIMKPKKLWKSEFDTLIADRTEVAPQEKVSYIPDGISLADAEEHGFYVQHNSYYFKDRNGKFQQRSNFKMTPLFHIESTTNAKRLYEVVNSKGTVRVVEIPQKDLVSISAFRVRIESLGNFWWSGSESDLMRLKAWLYDQTLTAVEIDFMGWQKQGFFAWGNGIYNGKFTATDKYGIVSHKKEHYYIPAFSAIYEKEENLYEFERKFKHMEGSVTLIDYTKKFTHVFGDNGKIAFCFAMASVFRDIIVRRFDAFPLLNLFGPKGAGKNACSEMLLHMFGLKPKMPNLHNTSKAALADHVATSCNALCGFDEYRNDIEMEKREFLKGLWDGTGRTRMNMDKDKKKETTRVEQGVMVCGQQMMTADIALFSRVIILGFNQVKYTDEEMSRYDALKDITKQGVTHLTHLVLKHRSYFREHYSSNVEETSRMLKKYFGDEPIETRIMNNWLCVLTAYATLNNVLELPWDVEETIKIAAEMMIKQNREIKKSDDLGTFWKTVQYLIQSNVLLEGGDYKSAHTSLVTRRSFEGGQWKTEHIEWSEGKNVLWLTTSRVFSLYKQQCKKEGDNNPLPETTVEYYLRNSKAFLFDTKKESFKKIDPRTGMQEESTTGEDDEKKTVKKRTSTSALLFNLDLLPEISLSAGEEEDEKQMNRIDQKEEEKKPELPF